MDEEPTRFSGSAKQGALVPHANPSAAAAPPTAHQRIVRQQVPPEILNNAALAAAMSVLPANYNFEIHKTVWRIQQAGAKQVALQFPEGLLMYSCAIADILQEFAGVEHCYVMGDVTYGACCIDDFSAAALGAELLVHYGHSCLVPVDITSIPCLYVFVDIQIDVDHLVDTIRLNFPPVARPAAADPSAASTAAAAAGAAGTAAAAADSAEHIKLESLSLSTSSAAAAAQPAAEQQQQQPAAAVLQPPNLILAGTIQFSSAIQLAKQRLAAEYPSLMVPKCRPLSPGEVLGCTAPVIAEQRKPGQHAPDALVFVSDGRFHLEAIMIANPGLPAYRYDPYARKFTIETYDQVGMRAVRRRAIESAAAAKHWGVVLGTLGRQGNPRTMQMLQEHLQERGASVTPVLLSEVSPPKLAAIGHVEAWVQIACPRLSIDWGEGFSKPTLTPYEAMIALGLVPGWWEEEGAAAADGAAGVQPYPMDYYAKDGGEWNSSYHKAGPAVARPARQAAATVAAPA